MKILARLLLLSSAVALCACASLHPEGMAEAPVMDVAAEPEPEMKLALACPQTGIAAEDGIGGTGCPARAH